ncbi:MAG: leucine-rich repeat domain-containing protein [Treponema sp.]|nr:leucine-rich repeat domain-containing protein [Treponema sp.]
MNKNKRLFSKVTKATKSELFRFTRTEDNTITITGYTGKNRRVVIPSEIDGLPVTAIDSWAFKDIPIKQLTLPETLSWIGGEAFIGNHIKALIIPDSVTIKSDAFTSDVRPRIYSSWDNLDFISYKCFDSRLLSITIRSGVTFHEDAFGHENGFPAAYESNGPGTYTRKNFNSVSWTKVKE